MGRGFAVKPNGTYDDWYNDEQDFDAKKPRLTPGAIFVLDDPADPRVAVLSAEKAAKEAELNNTTPTLSLLDDLAIIQHTGSTTNEVNEAKARINGRSVPGRP